MHHSTEGRRRVTERSARAAIDPYVVDEVTFTRSEIMRAREEARVS